MLIQDYYHSVEEKNIPDVQELILADLVSDLEEKDLPPVE